MYNIIVINVNLKTIELLHYLKIRIIFNNIYNKD